MLNLLFSDFYLRYQLKDLIYQLKDKDGSLIVTIFFKLYFILLYLLLIIDKLVEIKFSTNDTKLGSSINT